MNIVIIEDEVRTALDLKNTILILQPGSRVIAMIDSVESGIEWFTNTDELPDIIFSDIQLGDGLAFNILNKVELNCPVIFCTAYDEYAMQAFQNNGIDYLLKPIKEEALKKSLDKFNLLKRPVQNTYDASLLNKLMKEIASGAKSYKSTFLVSYREKMIPVKVSDIIFFHLDDAGVELNIKNNQRYRLHYSLDYIESLVDPKIFYRVNRQYLLAHPAIKEVETYYDRKLLIHINHPNTEALVVSKAKASAFLKWLENA